MVMPSHCVDTRLAVGLRSLLSGCTAAEGVQSKQSTHSGRCQRSVPVILNPQSSKSASDFFSLSYWLVGCILPDFSGVNRPDDLVQLRTFRAGESRGPVEFRSALECQVEIGSRSKKTAVCSYNQA